jgi:2-polyprenyl-3-methyl-5-hydroxy-6-metoxy-1,4-benzoquinol methylase
MKTAKEIIGIDIHTKFLADARAAGYNNIYYCDITNDYNVGSFIKTHGKFKHIIATDVIEHIGNISAFLDNIYRLMEDDGFLYLTTPNVRSPHWTSMFLGLQTFKVNDDHICWFEKFTLSNMLRRSKLKIQILKYYHHPKDKSASKRYYKLPFKTQMGRRMYAIVQKEEQKIVDQTGEYNIKTVKE